MEDRRTVLEETLATSFPLYCASVLAQSRDIWHRQNNDNYLLLKLSDELLLRINFISQATDLFLMRLSMALNLLLHSLLLEKKNHMKFSELQPDFTLWGFGSLGFSFLKNKIGLPWLHLQFEPYLSALSPSHGPFLVGVEKKKHISARYLGNHMDDGTNFPFPCQHLTISKESPPTTKIN